MRSLRLIAINTLHDTKIMNWLTLIDPGRSGEQSKSVKPDITRSVFEQDFDRIIFSYPFRRLQDKTQVFPLPETDFVHSRLTHSLEVSSVARSLGRITGETIIARNRELKADGISPYDFGSITGAASLAHDIGNPPFGHSGEESISDFFLNHDTGKKIIENLDEKQQGDLLSFEGNAQGFRVLTHKNYQGLKLTHSTLAAFSKYPLESVITRRDPSRKSQKKYGFFQTEKEVFRDVAESVGLLKISKSENVWCRHPMAFLVEAADDICYSIIDLEDGCNLDLISLGTYKDLLVPFLKEKFDNEKFNSLGSQREKVSLLRAMTIDTLVRETALIFLDHEQDILSGKFDSALTGCIVEKIHMNEIEKISIEKIYRSVRVMETEAAGYRVLQGMLEMMLPAAIAAGPGEEKIAKGSKIILNTLPAYYSDWFRKAGTLNEIIHLVLDYISGMTDSSALKYYRLIKGISLPGSR